MKRTISFSSSVVAAEGQVFSDLGDEATPVLSADIQTFSRTCPLTGDLPGSMAVRLYVLLRLSCLVQQYCT